MAAVKEYSTCEAKTKFAEIIRAVMSGQRVVINYRGRQVAEVRPVEPPATTLAARVAELERIGAIGSAPKSRPPLRPLAHREGALQRFLDERE